jgi:DNA-binding MarR family transcriptional regulator
MQLLLSADISRQDLNPLADELSERWFELGAVLRSRRLVASLHPGVAGKMTPSKLRALDLLARQGGMRVGELATEVGIDDATATRLADRLEEIGVVERRREPGDRRATTVVLTWTGKELVKAIAAQRQLFFCEVLEALDQREREELVRLTAKAAVALRARSAELVGG